MEQIGRIRRHAPRAGLLLLGAAIVCTLTWTAWSLTGRPGHLGHFFNAWVYNAAIVCAALTCIARGAVGGRARHAWILLGAGLGFWAAGNALSYTSFGYDEPLTRLSWVDACFLLALPCLFAGVALLVRVRVGRFPIAGWFDALAAGLAVTAVAVALLAPSILVFGHRTTVDELTNTVYPFVDILILGFLCGTLLTHGARGSRAMQLVAAGIFVWAATDIAFAVRVEAGTYSTGTLDALWPLGAILIAGGAIVGLVPRERRRAAYRSPRGLAAASGAIAVTLLCVGGLDETMSDVAVVIASLSVFALVLRLLVASREYDALLGAATDDAVTDELTGLFNRRKLFEDLSGHLGAGDPGERLLAIFDLNGFKDYNDAFGHSAGDALLRRLGESLEDAVVGVGQAYRLGGDEFCILCDPAKRSRASILHHARLALTENGEAFSISASGGDVTIPLEASEPEEALRKADSRMYAEKRGSSRAERQTASALIRVLREREPALEEHLHSVAEAAAMTANALGMDAEGIDVVRRAAELHDIGKVAIPDEILHKPGRLDTSEMELMKSHTIAGERILGSSQAMRPVASLVRSSHERWDGGGYPDGLAGEEIPLGARVIFVCDAFDAMTSERPYQPAVPVPDALDELRRNAGTQFDPNVVDVFCGIIAERGTPQWADERPQRPPELAAEPPRDIPRGR